MRKQAHDELEVARTHKVYIWDHPFRPEDLEDGWEVGLEEMGVNAVEVSPYSLLPGFVLMIGARTNDPIITCRHPCH